MCSRRQDRTDAGIYYCPTCRMQFDDEPDEGGDYLTDTSRRMEQQEEWKARRSDRR